MEITGDVVYTIHGIKKVLAMQSKSKYIFDDNQRIFVSLRPIPESLLLLEKDQLPRGQPIPPPMTILEVTSHYLYTTEGIKQVYLGSKGGKYIYFDGVYVNLKKLPEYAILIGSKAAPPPAKPVPVKSTLGKFLDFFKKKPALPLPSPPSPVKTKVDYSALAKQVYSFLSKKRKYVKGHTSVFTRIERLQESVPVSFSDDIVESINIGIAAISYPSEYPSIKKFGELKTNKEQLQFLKSYEAAIKTQRNMDMYISMATYYLYKDILYV